MENIIEPTSDFDFLSLHLENPLPCQGGSFFTRLNFSDKKLPLYLQLPKAKSKHGIIRNTSTTKAYIDLLFGYFENDLLTWFENLETRCRELIHEKKDLWFQTELSLDDIENMFISPTKPYKSGKYISIRTHIPMSKQIKEEYCMIYDEMERQLDRDCIDDTIQFIPLIHIEGIKFSSKSFQLDINIRQIMVISLENSIKKSCLIKSSKNLDSSTLEKVDSNDVSFNKKIQKPETTETISIQEPQTTETNENTDVKNFVSQDIDNKLVNEEIKVDEIENNNDLAEINLDVDNLTEEFQLKKPKDVYYEIYKTAHEKARQMKKVAIEAYLDAQNIKSKYMLDDILNSDDEISNFSEFEEEIN